MPKIEGRAAKRPSTANLKTGARSANRYFSVVSGSIDTEDVSELEQDHLEFQVGYLWVGGSDGCCALGWIECCGEGVLQTYGTEFFFAVATEAAVFIQ